MPTDNKQFSGLLAPEPGDMEALLEASTSFDAEDALTCSQPETLLRSPPFEVRTEQQGRTNSCCGHAMSSVLEWVAYLATGNMLQLSRAYAYRRAQLMTGIQGDAGAQIRGGVEAAMKFGCPPETVMPWTGQYQPYIVEGADEAAKPFKSASQTPTMDYKTARAFLGQRIGGILFGMTWEPAHFSGVVPEPYIGNRMGEHALAAIALSTKVDGSGQPFIWVLNSHGPESGYKGWFEYSPKAWDGFIRASVHGAWGLSDMKELKPRPIDPDKDRMFA